ncbi:hypothetical protein FOXG_22589 [Fusarium oxysporum f. sp. lycopersici 4287]|uniref:Uncharacterized protein n=1 Tax=Fusarium oxysporum f. sp. lycopersici (strain 4287 / CBS 123668 / FGSC 9935 / NRRL 34936) TaxID=426428 RepID=A0A0J9WAB2_FUSO4|nr:hypothetical protein FOXG_22589 [Fusarium oxysporum f. sp. lycopersici 4287]KNB19520.1 hypothetical protein FOXG_22589 [Fusarium oxysporum f. sp. lycopersici 4287]
MAGEFVAGQLEILRGICKVNHVNNLVCGWPLSGSCKGVARPVKSEQAKRKFTEEWTN